MGSGVLSDAFSRSPFEFRTRREHFSAMALIAAWPIAPNLRVL
jgi:hypothetical protein